MPTSTDDDFCDASEIGTDNERRSLAAANASGVVGTEIVSVQCGATDIESPSGSRLDGTCVGARVNGVSFCRTKADQ